jgi:hypothetical protein
MTHKGGAGARKVDCLEIGDGVRHIVDADTIGVACRKRSGVVGIGLQQGQHSRQIVRHLELIADRPQRLVCQRYRPTIPELTEIKSGIEGGRRI